MLARFPICADDIARVTTAFYAKIRTHPQLGPVFAAHVTDWPAHEAKITGFWCNAILMERSYNGNPMQTHNSAGNVQADHFPIWLDLFDDTLKQELKPEMASAWSALAHRIGRGLSMGLRPQGITKNDVPKFR